QGLITIKNLPFNADVKITDLTGNLIYQTKAVGGQAVWDGYNFKGKRPNSGVLIVFASNADGSLKVAGKIFFVK
ncbi:MAG: Por secretion system protein, partial [Bacteroidales bacterium]